MPPTAARTRTPKRHLLPRTPMTFHRLPRDLETSPSPDRPRKPPALCGTQGKVPAPQQLWDRRQKVPRTRRRLPVPMPFRPRIRPLPRTDQTLPAPIPLKSRIPLTPKMPERLPPTLGTRLHPAQKLPTTTRTRLRTKSSLPGRKVPALLPRRR